MLITVVQMLQTNHGDVVVDCIQIRDGSNVRASDESPVVRFGKFFCRTVEVTKTRLS